MRTCKRCGRELPETEFFAVKGRTKFICKSCESAARSAAKNGGGGQLAKYTKEHLLNELNRRGIAAIVNPTPRELMAMLKRYGYEGELRYTETKVINLKDID